MSHLPLPQIPEGYEYVKEEESALEQIDILDKFEDLAADSETHVKPEYRHLKGASALDPHTGRMSLLTLQGRDQRPVIFDLLLLERAEWNRYPLYKLLKTRRRLIMHNGSFDGKFIKKHFGFIPLNIYCTLLMHKLIGNATGSKYAKLRGHGLADVLRDWFGVHIKGKGSEQVTDWYARPEAEDEAANAYWLQKLLYAANDVVYLHPLCDAMEKVICDPLPYSPIIEDSEPGGRGLGMSQLLPMEMRMASVGAEMEYNGLPASRELFRQMKLAIYNEETDEGLMVEAAVKLCKYFDLETCPTLWTDDEVPTEKSYRALNNPTQLKKLIAKHTGLELDSTQTQALERFIDLLDNVAQAGTTEFVDKDEEEQYRQILDYEQSVAIETSELAQTVVQYKQLSKLLSFDFEKYINPLTGCIHSRVDMLGAATGRSSSSALNLQNVPARTYLKVERPIEDPFPSSANYEHLNPDWEPPRDEIFDWRPSIRSPYERLNAISTC